MQRYEMRGALALALVAAVAAGACNRRDGTRSAEAAGRAAPACPPDNGDLTLSAGFCATVFADSIGHARHIAVAPSGVVYVNTWSGRYYGNEKPPAGGFIVVPGSFVTVTLQARRRGFPEVPAGALIVRGDTTLVAVVDSANRVGFRRVAVARDDGQSAEIAGGVEAGQRVALNLGDSVDEGAPVQPVEDAGAGGRR